MKILYVHGFASSGQSGTVKLIREMMPEATVVAPDLPIHPAEAMELLRNTCAEEQPDLIIGTSMGGMYTEMLHGYDRILVNPAFQMGETITKNGMMGKVVFQNPRKDGIQEFIMTKSLQEEYRDMTRNCFKEIEPERVYGVFGLEDPVVHTRDLFLEHYPNCISFHGEHRLNDKILHNVVLPVIRWIRDKQQKREKPVMYVSVEETMEHGGVARSSVSKAIKMISDTFDIYFVAAAPTNDPDYTSRIREFVFETVGVLSFNRIIFTNQKHLLYGDYLIDALKTNGSEDFLGTRLELLSDTFKTWEDLIEYFQLTFSV